MIPKTIHYCWFGGNKLPKEAVRCIESWKVFFPDYEIQEWNESNFDINRCAYVKEAYEAKKWAFVSDYARFWILYHYGGLYFDTDVEVISDFSDIVAAGPFMGSEKHMKNRCRIAAGLGLGVSAKHPFFKELLDFYDTLSFRLPDGAFNDETVVTYVTDIAEKYGYCGSDNIEDVMGITVYPPRYFSPMNCNTGSLDITADTKSIHWYVASWKDDQEIEIHKTAMRLYKKMPNFVGSIISSGYESVSKVFLYGKREGVRRTIYRIVRKITKV